MGDDATGSVANNNFVAATGAKGVLAAALETKESIEAQQAFHAARLDWANDNLAPQKKIFDGLTSEIAGLDAEIIKAQDRLDAAKEACKVAAFKFAQKARL